MQTVDSLHEGDTVIKPAKRSTEANVQKLCNRYRYCFGVCADVVGYNQNHSSLLHRCSYGSSRKTASALFYDVLSRLNLFFVGMRNDL